MRWNHVRNNFGKTCLEAENYLVGFNAQKMLHAMNGRQKFPKTCSQKIEANSFQKLAVRPTSSASFLNFAVSTTAFRPIVGGGLRIQNRRARNEHVCQIMCRGGCVNFIQFFLVWTCVRVCALHRLRHFCCNGEGRALKQRVPRKCSPVLWGNISFDSWQTFIFQIYFPSRFYARKNGGIGATPDLWPVLCCQRQKHRKYRGFWVSEAQKTSLFRAHFAPRISKIRENTVYLMIFSGATKMRKQIVLQQQQQDVKQKEKQTEKCDNKIRCHSQLWTSRSLFSRCSFQKQALSNVWSMQHRNTL